MSRLPLTGKTLYDRLQNSTSRIRVCQTSSDDAQSFFDKTVWLEGIAGASADFHEYFHAGQYANGAFKTLEKPQLTTRDNIFFSLLFEASALSFQLITEQEAKDRGIVLPKPPSGHGFVSDEPDIRKNFQAAYNKALKKSGKEKALETAGRETVRYLLAGKNYRWQESYKPLARDIAGAAPSQVTGENADYKEQRRKIFLHAGYVSSKINLTPEEFLGTNADNHLAGCFDRHFSIENKKILLTYQPPPSP